MVSNDGLAYNSANKMLRLKMRGEAFLFEVVVNCGSCFWIDASFIEYYWISIVNVHVVIDHLDHICQLAGNCLNVGIGSDLDGAFGREQCPYDLETITDLQKLEELLKVRGYADDDVSNVLQGNWIRFLRRAWA